MNTQNTEQNAKERRKQRYIRNTATVAGFASIIGAFFISFTVGTLYLITWIVMSTYLTYRFASKGEL